MVRYFVATALVGFACLCAAQDSRQPSSNLTLADVVSLVKSGASEAAIVASIKRRNRPFDLNADEIAELKREGVSAPVISELIDPATPYTPPPPPPPQIPLPAPGPPLKDPLILKIPPEPGIYWLVEGAGHETFQVLELKPIMPLKTSSGVVAKLAGPLKNGDRIGFLVGGASSVRVGPSGQVFYARLGTKVAIDDIVIVRMEKADQRRLLDFGKKPDKPILAPESILPFESTALADGIYRLNVKSINSGEYVLLVLGSGDEKKGILGKGYEFGVGTEEK